MSTMVHPWSLQGEQADRLLLYMQTYRDVALTTMPPTLERNATLRLVQALQGKLLAPGGEKPLQLQLLLTGPEVSALKEMAHCLLTHYGNQTDAPERTRKMTDVGRLYLFLQKEATLT